MACSNVKGTHYISHLCNSCAGLYRYEVEKFIDAEVGKITKSTFKVVYKPSQSDSEEHHICKKDSNDRIGKFIVSDNHIITFHNVKDSDSGSYFIHPKGLNGEFYLNVGPATPPEIQPSASGTITYITTSFISKQICPYFKCK